MSLTAQLYALLNALGSANQYDVEQLLNTALQYYSRVKSQVLQSISHQWNAQWPAYLPSDLSNLCRDGLIMDPPDPDVSQNEVREALWRWHHELFDLLERFCSGNEEKEATKTPQKTVLCGFNVVNDVLFSLARKEDLSQLVQAWGIPTSQQVQPRAIGKPRTPEDILACLLYAAQNPDTENKLYVEDPDLLRNTILAGAGPNGANLPEKNALGGAAGNSAYVLSNLNIKVDICCPYESGVLPWNQLGGGNACHLDFTRTPPTQRPVQQGQAGLPARQTVGFQLIPSPPWTWHTGPNTLQVSQPSRALFISSDASSPQPKHWNDVVVVYNRKRVQWPSPSASPQWTNSSIWPYPPLFSTWKVRGRTLQIHPTSPSVLSRLAQARKYAVAIVKDAGYPDQLDLVMQVRKAQLTALQGAGVPIHVELSGGSNLGLLKDSLSTGPWSVSLNQDDLLKLTGENRSLDLDRYASQSADPFLLASTSAREGLFERFLRAKHLLQILSVKWIYVHGNELDIAVWQPDEDQQLGERLRDAMLLAKAVVVAAMISRNTPPNLYPLVMHYIQGSTLAPKGFWALFEFVTEFASFVAARYSLPSSQDVREAFLTYSGNCGWFQNQDLGVAAAPVFWPDVARFLNATGAGDYSSAVVAAYVWGK